MFTSDRLNSFRSLVLASRLPGSWNPRSTGTNDEDAPVLGFFESRPGGVRSNQSFDQTDRPTELGVADVLASVYPVVGLAELVVVVVVVVVFGSEDEL